MYQINTICLNCYIISNIFYVVLINVFWSSRIMIFESYYISDVDDSKISHKKVKFSDSIVLNFWNIWINCKFLEISQNLYFKRIFKFYHMDFEYALWQLCYIFLSPQKVYRNFQYRKSNIEIIFLKLISH